MCKQPENDSQANILENDSRRETEDCPFGFYLQQYDVTLTKRGLFHVGRVCVTYTRPLLTRFSSLWQRLVRQNASSASATPCTREYPFAT
jgi:hypothetical protein